MHRVNEQRMSVVLKKAMREAVIRAEDTTMIFQDILFSEKRIEEVKKLFPDHSLHTLALKANPLPRLLEHFSGKGVGAEAATWPELYIAQKAGFPPSAIVFDSPAKTEMELRYALSHGVHINADSFEELGRLNKLIGDGEHGPVGIRVNPQVGVGRIEMLSVAGTWSKFGVPLETSREQLFASYEMYPWLNGIHLHIGSQGCSPDQLVEGVKRVYAFAEEVNTRLKGQRIRYFDLGGGFPVSYHKDREPESMEAYAEALRQQCSGLFSGCYKLVTEFGRYYFANSGWTATRVEYIKSYGGKKTAVVHVGADLLMRRIYQPDDWYHEMSALDRDGSLKTAEPEAYVIAGPLCFNGDIISHSVMLPRLEVGDFVLIHDTGGYTLSMWNRHTSRQIPLVLGYTGDGDDFIVLKERETLEDVYRFWK